MSWRNADDDPDVLAAAEEQALLRGAPWRRFAGVGDPVAGHLPLDWSRRVARGLRRQRPSPAFLGPRRPRPARPRAR